VVERGFKRRGREYKSREQWPQGQRAPWASALRKGMKKIMGSRVCVRGSGGWLMMNNKDSRADLVFNLALRKGKKYPMESKACVRKSRGCL
jgi:hypothetical protein